MSGIVCPIRGGAASQPTVAKAISVAQESRATVYFLYVVNLDFLLRTTHTRTGTIQRELREMGEFIVLAAQTKAAAQGVTAESIVREGDSVREEIIRLCHEVDADVVVLGRPRQAESDVFTEVDIEDFGRRLAREAGAQVVFAEAAE